VSSGSGLWRFVGRCPTHRNAGGAETSNEVSTVIFVKIGGKWKVASARWTPKTLYM
jgi:hypothetical protein